MLRARLRPRIFLALGALASAALSACVSVPTTQVPSQPGAGQAAGQAAVQTSSGTAAAVSTKVDPQILTALQNLLDTRLNYSPNITPQNSQTGTPEGDLINLGSPAGYELRNHYLNIGVPLAEAFAANPDPDFAQKLTTMARWSSNTETRAAAMLILAQHHDAKDLPVFQEALNFIDPGVRFGAIEALSLWQNPVQAVPLLAQEADSDPETILRVTAAGALARLGDDSGLHRLRAFLNDGSWLIRAMAARYLGDYGTAEDYDLLVSRISQEQGNDFVVAEDCIGALKLFPKKNP